MYPLKESVGVWVRDKAPVYLFLPKDMTKNVFILLTINGKNIFCTFCISEMESKFDDFKMTLVIQEWTRKSRLQVVVIGRNFQINI